MKHLLFFGIAFAAFHISHSNIPEFCKLKEDEGEGTSFVFSLYYNEAKDQCEPFIYKGQGGNANRFQHERECIRNCSINAEKIYPMEASIACRFPKILGGCNGQYLRYYYDSVRDKCKKFLYTGCMGNGNRFVDQISCNATCAGIHDEGNGDELEEDEPDTPIAIICGVLLAAIIASVFITVIVLTVKSKKKESKKMATRKNKDDQNDLPLREQGTSMA